MTFTSRTTKLAYVLHGALSLLVVGVLSWATFASLKLERAERTEKQAGVENDRANAIRLAMYRMESWAGARLGREIYRLPSDYTPLYFPSGGEVRLRSGEILPAGVVVLPSPLLLNPPDNDWILVHFQASPREGYRSPQLAPRAVRSWPAFDADYDNRSERYEAVLAGLAYAYTVDELTEKYNATHGGTDVRHTHKKRPPLPVQPAFTDRNSTADRIASREYQHRKNSADFVQRSQTLAADCTPQQLAVANILSPGAIDELEFANKITDDEEVAVRHDAMHATWLKLANRPAPDLAFLRAVTVDGETAIQGFLVDWPRFRDDLLAVAKDLFPQATIEILDAPPLESEPDDSVFTLMPARLIPNEPPLSVAQAGWSTSRSLLLTGWIGSIGMLLALGLGIRSLVAVSERRSQFAYAVTHELRTPLTTFRLYTDMLAQGLVGEENRQEYLDTLNAESQRLADLVSGVLEYSRVENDSVPVNRECVSVGDILDSVREVCSHRCESAGVRFEIDANGCTEQTLHTDRQHAVQIVGNLVDNACKYGRNGPQSAVKISAIREDGMQYFDVIDDGPGIPPKLRNVIFKPYRRGDTDSTPATGGIGLGLALSRSWAELLGGHLELVTTPRMSRGACFRLSLPLHT